MAGFRDIHQHIVYGIDDGPQSLEASAKMLVASCKDGVRQIIATSHIVPGREAFNADAYHHRLDRLNHVCRFNKLPMALYPGAEILYTSDTARFLQENRIPTLCGSRFVLVEFMPDVAYTELCEAARVLCNIGYIPVFAHIERYDCLVHNVSHAQALKEQFGLRLQVNCSSVIKGKSLRSRRFLQRLFSDHWIDYVATDSHNTDSRPTNMTACFEKLKRAYGHDYAVDLTGGNQSEIFPPARSV